MFNFNKNIYIQKLNELEEIYKCYGLFGMRGGGKGSRVELTENKLILGQFFSTLLYSPSIQTDHSLDTMEREQMQNHWTKPKVHKTSQWLLTSHWLNTRFRQTLIRTKIKQNSEP